MRDAGDARDARDTETRAARGRGDADMPSQWPVPTVASPFGPPLRSPSEGARRFGAPSVLNLNEGESGKGSLPSGMMSVVPGPMDPLPLLVPSGARPSDDPWGPESPMPCPIFTLYLKDP